MRIAALYHLAAVRIERVIHNPLGCILFVVVLEAEMPKAFGDSFEDMDADADRRHSRFLY